MNAFSEGRMGRVFVSRQLIEEASAELRLLFMNFVPLQAVYRPLTDCYEYAGYSDKFDAIAPQSEDLARPVYTPLFKSEIDLLSNERIISFLEYRRS